MLFECSQCKTLNEKEDMFDDEICADCYEQEENASADIRFENKRTKE